MKRHICLAAVLVALLAEPPLGADSRDTRTSEASGRFHSAVDVNVVNVEVFVTDADGTPVRGLKAEDFLVTEDGVRVDVTHFLAVEDGRPAGEPAEVRAGAGAPGDDALVDSLPENQRLLLVLWIDNHHLQIFGRNSVLAEVREFVESRATSGERMMLLLFDLAVTVETPITADRGAILGALADLKSKSGGATLRRSEGLRVMAQIDSALDRDMAMNVAR